MNDETTTTETTARGGQLSRRSVVRTAANAAWAVPLVQVAAAAPAMAAASATYSIIGSATGNKTYSATLSSTNHPAGTAITVAFTLASSNADWDTTQTNPPGWTHSLSVKTLTFTSSTQTAGTFALVKKNSVSSTVSATVTVSGNTVASTSF